MNTLAIIGASGHGKVIADLARTCGFWHKIVFYDDAWPDKTINGNFPIVGNTQSLLSSVEKPDIIVGIGNNKIRLAKQKTFIDAGFNIASVIHPRAIVSLTATIGIGSVVMAGAVINSDAIIGSACIINSNSVVEHDCILADAVHVSPGASLAGGVSVGECSWLGIGSSVIQLKVIGKNVIVGASAAVVADVPDNVTVVGVPAKIIKS